MRVLIFDFNRKDAKKYHDKATFKPQRRQDAKKETHYNTLRLSDFAVKKNIAQRPSASPHLRGKTHRVATPSRLSAFAVKRPSRSDSPNLSYLRSTLSHYVLSKTAYIKGLQCPKALFFYRHYPQLRDPIPPARQATFTRGHEVGVLARKLFPGGKDATEKAGPKSSKAVARTQELIAAGETVIYEAAFVHEQVLVLVDILVRDGENWKAYEVKSSLRLSKAYYQDAALQYFVLSGAGIVLSDFSLVHVNGEYLRNGPLDLEQLFRVVSVMRFAQERAGLIAERVAGQKLVLKGKQAPDITVGEQCFSPYECDFRGQCWKNIPAGNVFGLTGVSRSEQARYFNSGIVLTENIPEAEPLPRLARLQVHTSQSGQPVIEKDKLRDYLSSLGNPLLFLDIENFQPAVPRYDGTHPFMALPFAYSIHRRNEDGSVEYLSFMAEPGPDPREEFMRRFLEDTEGDALILSYDAGAERTALNLLKRKFPEHTEAIDQRLGRLRDLMQPFSEGWFHHPDMNGSVSLKNVLPALVPGLNYESLAIQNGSHAMAVYEKLGQLMDIFALAEQKEALEEYSRIDTYGMVKIFEVLEAAAQ